MMGTRHLLTLVGTSATLAAVLFFFLTSTTLAATRQEVARAASTTICIGDVVPDGEVVIARSYVSGQCNDQGNVLVTGLNVETLESAPTVLNTAWICDGSPIPASEVVIAKVPYTPDCQGSAREITPATGNAMTICQDSPIPADYQQTGATIKPICGIDTNAASTNNALIIQPAPVPAAPLA